MVKKINENTDIKEKLCDSLSIYNCCETDIEIRCKDSDKLLNQFIKAMLKQIRGNEDKIDLSSMNKFYKSSYFKKKKIIIQFVMNQIIKK